ncbi:GNAT family N-acetyltransferase [Luteolibacter luteus]|uniref:GNAT family N-acetyltransferase n=1 Tax=Luteolibacter luteus TaxID=2728835 RepID=A0A858RMJ6_9BACT|nr:GNAT family N-acetyltransferase [Luteolibacter luteus]QJE97400.1 GNAT family N-acetyltransferase [Luteolibacter luteus]
MIPRDFELQAADESDAEPIYELYKELFQNHIDQIWGWDENWQKENFAKEWEEARTWRIDSQGQLSGYLQLRDEADFMYVLSLGILPAFQGRRIGRVIMRSLQQEAAGKGLPLRLSVFRTNPRALSFYQGLGFRVTEETEAFQRLEWLEEAAGGTASRG